AHRPRQGIALARARARAQAARAARAHAPQRSARLCRATAGPRRQWRGRRAPRSMRERATRVALGLLLVAALAVAVDNADRRLANPDEGRYSEISREMAASGDWVTPRLNGIKYFEKPPLQYWATATAFTVFGDNEFAARLYILACGLATILIVGFTALRLWNAEVALATMLALVASPYFLALGGIVTLDMGLTLWTTLTLCAFLLAEQRQSRRWMLVAWAAMALAVLSKGLVGIVFPVAAIGLHALIRRDFSFLWRLNHRL